MLITNGVLANTIVAPLPRRTAINNHSSHHLTKIHSHHHLLQPHNSKPIKLYQDPDEVLSEFLSLFNSSDTFSNPLLITHEPLSSSGTPVRSKSSTHHTNDNLSPPVPVKAHIDPNPGATPMPTIHTPPHISSPSTPPFNTTNPNRPSSPSQSTLDHSAILHQASNRNPNGQLGPATIANHLSSIVSSPISRCHNPLPRHAGLDVLACRLAEPFKSLHLDTRLDQDHCPEEKIESPLAREQNALQNCDDLPSDLIPFLNLDHSDLSNSEAP